MIAAIYSRKSKFSATGDSIENQIQMCKEYALLNLKDKNITEFIEYEDEGYSGGNTNRPRFQELLTDAKAKKFDILICYRLDRISRNVADFSTTLTLLQNYDIDFVSIKEQFDTTSPMGRAMIYIASVFAQLERETIAERVKDNMIELAKTGRWLGGVTPLGYNSKPIIYYDENMKERTMTKLTQNPEELKLVKLIFEKYIELKSLSKLESYLLENRFTTRRGSNFDKAKLRVILSNPVYAKSSDSVIKYLKNIGVTVYGEGDNTHGFLRYNKQKGLINNNGKITRVDRNTSEWIAAISNHTAIIEGDDWIMAQEILLKNKDKFISSTKTHNALLTGILRCSKCGSSMQISHGHKNSSTGIKTFYYVCSLKKFSKGTRCDSKNCRVDIIDSLVKNELKKIGCNKKYLLEQIIKNRNSSNRSKEYSLKNKKIKSLILDNTKKIDSLINKLSIDDEISDLLVSKIKDLKNENEKLNKELNSLSISLLNTDEETFNLHFTETLLNRCSLIDELNNDEVKTLITGLFSTITWNSDLNELNMKSIFYDDNIDSEESKKK